jgi:hypothetical protein
MVDIHYVAFGEDLPNYFDIVLDKPAISQYSLIIKYLSAEWNKSENKEKLRNIIGCLDKFSGSIYQVNRLVYHQKVFLSNFRILLVPLPM